MDCPEANCPGASDPGVCRHLARLQAWRRLSSESQRATIWAGDPHFDPSTEPTNGRLRVGLWCPCLGLGGAEIWQLALARAVDPRQVVWKGAAVIDGRTLTDPKMERELGSIMPVGHGLAAAKTLAATCDVIITWAVTDVSALLSGLVNPPAVIMACHFPSECAWGPGTEALLGGVSSFVAVSELAVDSTPPSIRDRVEVIWNAVEPRRLEVHRDRSTMRAFWGVPEEAPVVGYLGRLAPEKDPGAMIRLARELPEPWHVVIVGDGRERQALEQSIKAFELDRVHLVGSDSAAGDVLGAFDVLVVPSHYESFGLTMAEGLWAGVPVLATRSGLAKLVPGLVREIETGAGGREWAEALLLDRLDERGTRLRVKNARSYVRNALNLECFGQSWTSLIVRYSLRGKGGPSCSERSRVA